MEAIKFLIIVNIFLGVFDIMLAIDFLLSRFRFGKIQRKETLVEQITKKIRLANPALTISFSSGILAIFRFGLVYLMLESNYPIPKTILWIFYGALSVLYALVYYKMGK